MQPRTLTDWSYLDHITPGIPVSWYLDEAVLAVEKEVLFANGPGYVGHELLVPEPGDYQTLSWAEGWNVVRGRDGTLQLVSNVCRHRQAIMLQGRGNARNIVCPIHRWSYGLDGHQQAAPHFGCNPGRDLETKPLSSWNGLLFTGPRDVHADLAGFRLAPDYAFDGFVYSNTWVEEYPINWKTFIDFYIEILHVEPFHPGLTNLIDCDSFSPADWDFGDNWQNQRLRPGRDLANSRSDAYREYQKLIVDYRGGPPRYGALWLAIYPNVMVEWYPESLIVSHVQPVTADKTINVVDFYYPAEVLADRPEIVEAHQASYIETANEDGEIADRMDRGRRQLAARGVDDAGPYQKPMETGMAHFHDYLHRYLDGPLAAARDGIDLSGSA